MWIKVEKNTTSSEEASPTSAFVHDENWPSFVNDVCWARTKFISSGTIKRLGSRPFPHKPQKKVLLQTIQFQRVFFRVLENRCTHHKPVLLSLTGSAAHTNIQRAEVWLIEHLELFADLVPIPFPTVSHTATLPAPGPWRHQMTLHSTHTNMQVSSQALLPSETPSFCFTYWNINIESVQQMLYSQVTMTGSCSLHHHHYHRNHAPPCLQLLSSKI